MREALAKILTSYQDQPDQHPADATHTGGGHAMALEDDLQKSLNGLFPEKLGVRFLAVTKDILRA